MFQYATAVKALIDAGTCDGVTTTTTCGSSATGYYETFEYNGERVIIVSGAPDHAAETDLFLSDGFFNPNIRCKIHIFHAICQLSIVLFVRTFIHFIIILLTSSVFKNSFMKPQPFRTQKCN